MPWLTNFSRMSGSVKSRAISDARLSMIGFGVAAGARNP
jgi:hypothetical protein